MGALSTSHRRWHVRSRLALLVVFLIGGCGDRPADGAGEAASGVAGGPAVIRIGVAQPAPGNPPVFTLGALGIAYTKGWLEDAFEATGTRVELTFFKGAGPAVNEALASEQLDFAFQGDLPAVIARALGLETRLILASGVRGSIYVATPKGSALRSVAELKDRRVGFFKGTNVQLPFNRLLERHGLSERSLRAINLDTAASQAAILTGDIEAVVGGLELLRLRDEAGVRIIYGSQNDSPVYTRQAHVLVTQAFASQWPDATQRLVDVLVRAARWAAEDAHRDEVFSLWEQSGMAEKYWQEDLGTESLRSRLSPLMDPFFVARYTESISEARRLGLIRDDVSMAGWIDSTYLERAIRDQGLDGFWQPVDAEGLSLVRAQP